MERSYVLDIAETLNLHRERIVDTWVRRVHKEIGRRYATKPVEELFATVSEATDAYFDALVNHDMSGLDLLVERIGRMRSEDAFPLSDVQRAFDAYRSVLVPILFEELERPLILETLEALDACVGRAICGLSDLYQFPSREVSPPSGAFKGETPSSTGRVGKKAGNRAGKSPERAPAAESEERYRIAIEHSNDGVSLVRAGAHIFVNQKFANLFGYSQPGDVIGKNIDQTIHPDDLERVVAYHRNRQKGIPAPTRYEFKALKHDGSTVYIEASVSETLYLGEPTTLAYFRDITDRKNTERQLDQERETFFSVLQNAPYGIFLRGPEGETLFVNPEATEITGYTLDDIPAGAEWSLRVYPDEEYRKRTGTDRAWSGKDEGRDGVFNVTCRDGSVKELEFRSFELPDGKTVTMFQDITLRRRAEDDRARLEAELRQSQKMEAVGQLAGGVAHDFNNILTVLIGFSNLLQMKMKSDDPLRRYVDQIRTTSERAVNLTQSLLAFSRKQVIELKPQRLNSIVAGAEALLVRLLREDVELEVRVPEKSVAILADTTQIEQVLLNLATNAQDAMPTGGKLRIEVRDTEVTRKAANTLGLSGPGRYALISVSDTGIGMDGKTREKIFEPFFTTKAAGRGTGLGLSIVYGIVKQHNGYITVSSKPGKGSVFYVYLPVVRTEAREKDSGSREMAAGNETILVAEDDREVRCLTTEILEEAGYTVIEAVDGEDAVKKFLDHRDAISLLILDVVMPKKNGKRVLEDIVRVKPGIKTIFVSGYTGDVVLEKGIHGTTSDFISKPVAPGDLLHRVRRALDESFEQPVR